MISWLIWRQLESKWNLHANCISDNGYHCLISHSMSLLSLKAQSQIKNTQATETCVYIFRTDRLMEMIVFCEVVIYFELGSHEICVQ